MIWNTIYTIQVYDRDKSTWRNDERCKDFHDLMEKLKLNHMDGMLEGTVRVMGNDRSVYGSGKLQLAIENYDYIERMQKAFDKKHNIINYDQDGFVIEYLDKKTGVIAHNFFKLSSLVYCTREYFHDEIEDALDINLGVED